jgi:hypothetical protein
LPWWTPPKGQTTRTGYAFSGTIVEILKMYQDFVLFRETPDDIITRGCFDNNWKLPADAAEALKADGAVKLN